VPPVTDPTDDVVARLEALKAEVERSACCQLGATRSRLVFGEGDPHADLMFVGEAPGYHEDQQGRPFVGQAGKLLEQLLAGIGLTRERVFIANVLKCRPPNNRDPLPAEVAACEPHLWRQIELIKPRVICSLGNHATKLLSGQPHGITKVHGKPQLVRLGERQVHLYPIFHPAAALYTPSMLETLEHDFARLPEVLAMPLPGDDDEPAAGATASPEAKRSAALATSSAPAAPLAPAAPQDLADPAGAVESRSDGEPAPGPTEQLGLF
jgi:DNA polymerase